MAALALALFILMFGFGAEIFGWPPTAPNIQLALFCAFVFGIICGYRVRE